MAEGQAGFDCQIFIDSNEITEARDVNPDLTRGEINDTARDTTGWESVIPGLGKWGVSFTLVKKNPASTAATAVETAFYAGTVIDEVKVLDKWGNGFKGECSVVSFAEKQPYAGVVEVDVKLSGHGAPTRVSSWS